ncbi:alpha-tocopherol transfer protein-like isoform X2 [Adelges cooleyi]|uniref:alpha-tocopherol transfer protein-like isoform X2 n=1 Tax=Adelges cooleyi TaxID=133065 RepID=UPI00217FA463|nr:alpha-tocopherol transfer protein-like isoform X2 [Adelges cooleyi]
MEGQFKIRLAMLCVYVSILQVSGVVTLYERKTTMEEFFSGEHEKYPLLLMDDVNKLDERVKANKDVDKLSSKINKKMLIMFLHSGLFNVDEAYKIIVNNQKYSAKILAYFPESKILNIKEMESVHKHVSISIVPVPYEGKDDRHVYLQLKQTESVYFAFEMISQYFLMLTRFLISTNGTFDGLVVTVNADGLNFIHCYQAMTKTSFVKTLVKYLQTGLPIRLKAIHFVNAGIKMRLFNALSFSEYTSQQVKDKIYMYKTEEMQNVFDHVPVEYMPCEIGGRGKSHVDYSEETHLQMISFFYPPYPVKNNNDNSSITIES